MLKWLVTGKERGEVSQRICEDTLDVVKAEENDHYNKIYRSNRVNPLFQVDDPYIQFARGGLNKNCDLYRTPSCSSGYGSAISQEQLGNTQPYYVGRNEKIPTLRRKENVHLTVPSPIWPGFGRIHSWLQLEEENAADTKQLVSGPKSKSTECDSFRVTQPSDDCSEDYDDHSEKDPTSLDVLYVMKEEDCENMIEVKSKKRKDMHKLHLKSVASLNKRRRKKVRKVSTGYSKYCSDRGSYTADKETPKEYSSQKHTDQRSRIPKHGLLKLSANSLCEKLPHQAPYSGHFQASRMTPHSSSWILPGGDASEPPLYPWTHLDHGHGVWVEEKWRHQLYGSVEELGHTKPSNSYLVTFCKSFCFLLLLTAFVMVIVIVSVFLSKGTGQAQALM